jgi:mRNA-degrading endonuclease RelE of RelBE toxin-antitoxin system
MNYNVYTTPNFEKEAKRLKRKYPSLKAEIVSLIEELEKDPFIGTDIGNNVRKIRIAVQSKGKGKRGGARVMTCIKIEQESLSLFSIYSKGEQDSISNNKIEELIKEI